MDRPHIPLPAVPTMITALVNTRNKMGKIVGIKNAAVPLPASLIKRPMT